MTPVYFIIYCLLRIFVLTKRQLTWRIAETVFRSRPARPNHHPSLSRALVTLRLFDEVLDPVVLLVSLQIPRSLGTGQICARWVVLSPVLQSYLSIFARFSWIDSLRTLCTLVRTHRIRHKVNEGRAWTCLQYQHFSHEAINFMRAPRQVAIGSRSMHLASARLFGANSVLAVVFFFSFSRIFP